MMDISVVCTLALKFAKASSHYDDFRISVPTSSSPLFELVRQDRIIDVRKVPRSTREKKEKISEARSLLKPLYFSTDQVVSREL